MKGYHAYESKVKNISSTLKGNNKEESVFPPHLEISGMHKGFQ